MIKHIWFDFSETIGVIKRDAHNKLRYETYAGIVDKSVTPELIEEYEKLYEQHQHSNSAVFRSLGMPAGYWSDHLSGSELHSLVDNKIPEILEKLKEIVPISIFSNINLDKVLPTFHIDPKLFTHILSSSMVKEPKPALEGFYKIIELSKLPPEEILYIGDHIGKDILPAKKVGLKAGLIWSSSPEADYNFKNFSEILDIFKT